MLSKEKPTLVLSDHPPLQRMAPVLFQFLSGERQGVFVADHSMTVIARAFGAEIIPVYRDLKSIRTQTKGEAYKQKILAVLGALTRSKPSYENQGKAIVSQVTEALEDKNVFLAPSGATNRVAKWRPGVSHILTESVNTLQDFALSFVYIPDSFREKFSYVLFDSWARVLDNEALDWGENHRQNARQLQQYYESLRA
jgi:hypothetical protein